MDQSSETGLPTPPDMILDQEGPTNTQIQLRFILLFLPLAEIGQNSIPIDSVWQSAVDKGPY
jgi:hypothetical protein